MRRPPYAATVFATFVALTLAGAMAVGVLQGRSLLTQLRESVKLVVELRPNATPESADALARWLDTRAFVKSGSITYVSKEQGAERLREEFGDDFLRFDLDNPLFDVYTVNLTAATVAAGGINAARSAIAEREGVLDVYVQEGIASRLSRRVDRVALFAVILAVLLLVGVVALMLNTTRLALLSQATLIKNMELVGASWGFISRPFLRRAAWQGALAGLLAGLAVLGLSAFAKTSLPGVWAPLPPASLLLLVAACVAVGVVLNFGSTFVVVRRTLRMRVDDLAGRR